MPVTVPAAAVEVAGGAVSIGLMTEAEAAAAAAIMGLIWAALPKALLAGLEGFAATEVLGHIALHPSTSKLPNKFFMPSQGNQADTGIMAEASDMVEKGKAVDITNAPIIIPCALCVLLYSMRPLLFRTTYKPVCRLTGSGLQVPFINPLAIGL